jgi:DNA helicase-2/ATP-dependent DNA helicase PcrA
MLTGIVPEMRGKLPTPLYLYEVEFLKELNEAQLEAVYAVDGPVMVIAGAGSGKTRVLTFRLAFILSQGLADPHEMLALTFTNKAAKEMKERIAHLIGPEARSLQMGTFHSIFSRLLRVEAEKIGFTRAFTIYDSDDSQKLVRTILKDMRLDDKIYKPSNIRNTISGAKNGLISPQQLYDEATDDFASKAAQVYRIYEERLLKSNAMDFDDLLKKPIELFRSHPDVLHKYQHRFKYILVDEYQDTNHAQYLLCKMLAAVHENICVVGDDAQSIYAFRGANIANILNFDRDYPTRKLCKLEQNYRSTQNIVNAANSIIARNRDQIKKTVYTRNEEGDPILLIDAVSDQDEARRIASLIREQKQVHSLFNREIAILYRTNAQSRALEDELRKVGIKYVIYGGLSFYQRKEIKDVVAYLRLAINPKDEAAIDRIINFPARGIGQTTWERFVVFADKLKLNLWDALNLIEQVEGINNPTKSRIRDFVTMIESFGVAARNQNAYDTANYVAKNSGLLKEFHTKEDDGLERWENVQELLNAAQAFVEDPEQPDKSLEAFLANVSLATDQDKGQEDPDVVTLMTIHASKGLEFQSVFLAGMEEGLFPSSMSLETQADLEEERRLFYVAITRARKYLTLTAAKSRYKFGQLQFNEQSRFLDEIDPKFLKKASDPIRRDTQGYQPPSQRRGVVQGGPPPRQLTNRPAAIEPPADFKPASPEQIRTGMRVRHLKFGQGWVQKLENDASGKKATIDFDGKGPTVLLLKFARLEIIES